MENKLKAECLAPEKTIAGAEGILLYVKNLPEGANWIYYLQTLKEALWLDAKAGLVFIENTLANRELLEAFIFIKTQQVHIFKQGKTYKAAITMEVKENGNKTQYIESNMVLWGSYEKTENGFHYFSEERGMVTRVSEEIVQITKEEKEEKKKRLRLKQRDYIHFDTETLQAGFHHCRFISLT